MTVYFCGIGGAGLSAIANFCLDLGYQVFGSDLEKSLASETLEKRGVKIFYNQTGRGVQEVLNNQKIDWVVYSAGLKVDNPEILEANKQNLKISKRDDLINFLITKNRLKLVSIAGTHGKTTTTAMFSWVMQKMGIPFSHLIGGNVSWSNSGLYQFGSEFIFLETDEFDRNFLHFYPEYAVLTSVDYDHSDIYPTQVDYIKSFNQFLQQSKKILMYDHVFTYLGLKKEINLQILAKNQIDPELNLLGQHNRENANLVLNLLLSLYPHKKDTILQALNNFPGTQRRLEKLKDRVFSDYAHHPVEIRATLQALSEKYSKIVAIYQPHQNLRQYEIKTAYSGSFDLAKKVFWLPTYLSRENDLPILSADELVNSANHIKSKTANMNQDLANTLKSLWLDGFTLLFMGAGSIDTWAREIVQKFN